MTTTRGLVDVAGYVCAHLNLAVTSLRSGRIPTAVVADRLEMAREKLAGVVDVPAYPTPDQVLEGDDERVARVVADVRGAFATTGGERPVFEHLVDVEEVVRFVLLRHTTAAAGQK